MSSFDGRETDFWNQMKQRGFVEHREVKKIERKEARVSFAVEGQFVISPGKPYISRYRFLVQSLDIDADTIARRWKTYADEEK